MIRISRPATPPEILVTKGTACRQRHENEVSDGAKQIAFERAVYADETVKTALIDAQHQKCAFCEHKPLAGSFGDVEHFRPKAECRQSDAHPAIRPGYYWLAYDWSNLLFACELCNRRHKRAYFPLLDPAKRCSSPADSLAGESPVFIDPGSEDPAAHIGFREHVPFAIDASERGERTIEALGLRRSALSEDRRRHYETLRLLYGVAVSGGPHATRARDVVERMTAADAEYAAMCRAAVASWQKGDVPF